MTGSQLEMKFDFHVFLLYCGEFTPYRLWICLLHLLFEGIVVVWWQHTWYPIFSCFVFSHNQISHYYFQESFWTESHREAHRILFNYSSKMNYTIQSAPITYDRPVEVPMSSIPSNPQTVEMPPVYQVQPVPMEVLPINPGEVVKPIPTSIPQQPTGKKLEFDIMNSSSWRPFNNISNGTSVLCQSEGFQVMWYLWVWRFPKWLLWSTPLWLWTYLRSIGMISVLIPSYLFRKACKKEFSLSTIWYTISTRRLLIQLIVFWTEQLDPNSAQLNSPVDAAV